MELTEEKTPNTFCVLHFVVQLFGWQRESTRIRQKSSLVWEESETSESFFFSKSHKWNPLYVYYNIFFTFNSIIIIIFYRK